MPLHGALAFVTNSSVKDILSEATINFAASGDNTIVPAVSGKGIWVYKYFLVVSASVIIQYWDGPSASGTALTGPISLIGNEAMVFTFDTRPWYSMTTSNAFVINASNNAQVSGRAYYIQV